MGMDARISKTASSRAFFFSFFFKMHEIHSPIPFWLCLECQNTTGITEFFFFSHLVASSHEIFPKTGFIAFGLPPTQVYNNKKHISNFKPLEVTTDILIQARNCLVVVAVIVTVLARSKSIISAVVSVFYSLFPINRLRVWTHRKIYVPSNSSGCIKTCHHGIMWSALDDELSNVGMTTIACVQLEIFDCDISNVSAW